MMKLSPAFFAVMWMPFGVLVRRYEENALRQSQKMVGEEAAGDVVQRSFLGLYRALPRYQAQGKFPAYFYRLVLNEGRKWLRTQRSQNRLLDTLCLQPVNPVVQPEEKVLNQERRTRVQEALTTLSEKVQWVLILRYAGDMSLKEIATELEIPLGTVKSRLSAGLAKLRRVLETGGRLDSAIS